MNIVNRKTIFEAIMVESKTRKAFNKLKKQQDMTSSELLRVLMAYFTKS